MSLGAAVNILDVETLTDDASLMRRVLGWTPTAYPQERADAANALARAYLHCDLGPEARAQAEVAMARALDDPEPRVRRALAHALASSPSAPRTIVLALAQDIFEVSCSVLAQSPLLGDADLVDAVGFGDAAAQRAIARRPRLASSVAAAIAEVGERKAVMALIGNLDADLSGASLWRTFERFRDDAGFRERLAERPQLPAALRAALAAALADAVGLADVSEPRRAGRIARNGCEHAFAVIAAGAPAEELPELVSWLREAQHLTISLLMRGLACGDMKLFVTSLAEMAERPLARVEALVRDARGQGFAALYARAGLPAHLLPAFRAAAMGVNEIGPAAAGAAIGVNHALTMGLIGALERLKDAGLAPVIAMLWRFAAEGFRADAREWAQALEPAEALPALPSAPPVLWLDVQPGNENFAPMVELDPAAAAA